MPGGQVVKKVNVEPCPENSDRQPPQNYLTGESIRLIELY